MFCILGYHKYTIFLLKMQISAVVLAKLLIFAIIRPMAKKTDKKKVVTGPQIKNKKAYHNFELVEKVQTGIVLLGTEVKSLRDGQGDLDGSYARIKGGECWLVGSKIAQYPQASHNNHEPLRDRKLLLHKTQINKITIKLQQRGFTLVPLRIYFNERGLAKAELALARGKGNTINAKNCEMSSRKKMSQEQ